MTDFSGYLYAAPFEPASCLYAVPMEPIYSPPLPVYPKQVYPMPVYPMAPSVLSEPTVTTTLELCKKRILQLNELIDQLKTEKEVLEKMINISEKQNEVEK